MGEIMIFFSILVHFFPWDSFWFMSDFLQQGEQW